MKKAVVILIVAVMTAGAVLLWVRRGDNPDGEASETTQVAVTRGSIRQEVSATGRVVADLDVEIKCKASGEVVTLPYDVGDAVRKGDLLVELDPVDEERAVKQTEVALSVSQSRLAQARLNLTIAENDLATERRRAEAVLHAEHARARDAEARAERMKRLVADGLTSREEYDSAATLATEAVADLESARIRMAELDTEKLALELKRQDVALAEAQVESDRIALSTVRQRLADTKVHAPIDGVVTRRDVQSGQIISSGISNVGGGTTVLVLSDFSRMFVVASVDESDIGQVSEGQSAEITADAFPGALFSGTVVRIAPTGVNVSNVVTFEVKIEVMGDNKSLLKPEMTANVDIIVAHMDNALLVPAEAVEGRRHGRMVVVVRDDGTTEERPVEVGITDGFQTEITSGLAEGETVRVAEGGGESRWRRTRTRSPARMMPHP